jgi:hypothetical protein
MFMRQNVFQDHREHVGSRGKSGDSNAEVHRHYLRKPETVRNYFYEEIFLDSFCLIIKPSHTLLLFTPNKHVSLPSALSAVLQSAGLAPVRSTT